MNLFVDWLVALMLALSVFPAVAEIGAADSRVYFIRSDDPHVGAAERAALQSVCDPNLPGVVVDENLVLVGLRSMLIRRVTACVHRDRRNFFVWYITCEFTKPLARTCKTEEDDELSFDLRLLLSVPVYAKAGHK